MSRVIALWFERLYTVACSEPNLPWAERLGPDLPAWIVTDFLPRGQSDALWNVLAFDPRVTEPMSIDTVSGPYVSDYGKITFLDAALHDKAVLPEMLWGRTAPWPPGLQDVRDQLVDRIGQRFRVCVALHYAHGQVSMGYHADHEAYGDTSWIASLSLGATRTFSLRHVGTPSCQNVAMTHGSLVIMGPGCQQTCEHAILADPDCNEARINLTFRMFGE